MIRLFVLSSSFLISLLKTVLFPFLSESFEMWSSSTPTLHTDHALTTLYWCPVNEPPIHILVCLLRALRPNKHPDRQRDVRPRVWNGGSCGTDIWHPTREVALRTSDVNKHQPLYLLKACAPTERFPRIISHRHACQDIKKHVWQLLKIRFTHRVLGVSPSGGEREMFFLKRMWC